MVQDLRATEYFQTSQKIKRETETHNQIIEKLKRHSQGVEYLEEIGRGQVNLIYHLGQLPSGLWLAVRKMMPSSSCGSIQAMIRASEAYAQRAAILQEEGKRVPLWCICFADEANRSFGLITEDMTEGKKYTIKTEPGAEIGIRSDGLEVYLDLDQGIPRERESIWTHKDNRINLG